MKVRLVLKRQYCTQGTHDTETIQTEMRIVDVEIPNTSNEQKYFHQTNWVIEGYCEPPEHEFGNCK